MVNSAHEDRRNGHPRDLLLPYVENRLSGDEQARVAKHLADCGECYREAERLKRLLSCLKGNKDIFCPETWQLHELVESGESASARMREHLEQCPLCRQEVEAYREVEPEIVLPAALAQEVRREYGPETSMATAPVVRVSLPNLWDRFSSLFRVPVAAMAVAAAAVLAVVLIYPRGEIVPVMGMSQVSWGKEEAELFSKTPFAGQKKPRVAILLVFNGFRSQLPQAKVDELYESLAPTPELKRKYDFVTPRDAASVIKDPSLTADNRREVLDRLKNTLDVSDTLLLEITQKDNRLELGGSLVENASDHTIRRIPGDLLDERRLTSRLPELEHSLLKEPGSNQDGR